MDCIVDENDHWMVVHHLTWCYQSSKLTKDNGKQLLGHQLSTLLLSWFKIKYSLSKASILWQSPTYLLLPNDPSARRLSGCLTVSLGFPKSQGINFA